PHATRCCRAERSLRPCGASLPGSTAYGAEPLREPPHAHSSWDYCRSYAPLLHKCEELSGHFGGRFTLRNLERDGLVNRTVTPTVPPRVDYELTELGHALT